MSTLRSAIAKAIRLHMSLIARYPAAGLSVFASVVLVLFIAREDHRFFQAFGYLVAIWFCALATDVVVTLSPRPAIGFPIKRPVRHELFIILACTLAGLSFLCIRFSSLWPGLRPLGRLASISILFLFAFPVALALIFLLGYRYKPSELGINLRYWYLPCLTHLIIGGIVLTVAPDRSQWHSYVRENGISNLLFTGLITAALPEEFTRMLLQTRLAAAIGNNGIGFILATLLWALLHIPVDHSQSIHTPLWHVALSSLKIMPIGFLWGYMTYRTRSLLPSVLSHGLNLWGLQNL